ADRLVGNDPALEDRKKYCCQIALARDGYLGGADHQRVYRTARLVSSTPEIGYADPAQVELLMADAFSDIAEIKDAKSVLPQIMRGLQKRTCSRDTSTKNKLTVAATAYPLISHTDATQLMCVLSIDETQHTSDSCSSLPAHSRLCQPGFAALGTNVRFGVAERQHPSCDDRLQWTECARQRLPRAVSGT
ncbi:MAG: hypothetical protein MK010_10515, partial [Erythrobacter sp.]|nr:hypothetical protein [Erythrobacter sp.]